MDRNIFRYILRHSLRSQTIVLAMTVGSFPFLYATLGLPKLIINDALAKTGRHVAPGIDLSQVHYLFTLCGLFLGLVLISGAFKYVINVYKGITGERMLRRLSYELIPARHRLDLIDDALQARVLEARRRFRATAGRAERQCRVLRRRALHALRQHPGQHPVRQDRLRPGSGDRASDLMTEVLSDLRLHQRVVEIGLRSPTGVGGMRLSLPQRRKLALARALLKRREVLILYDVVGPPRSG
jgi:hypothetical protein